jgi:hypothetical protein
VLSPGGKSFALKQAWEERVESEPEPTGLKWTGAAVWDAAIVLSAYLHANSGLIQVLRRVVCGISKDQSFLVREGDVSRLELA